MSDVHAVVQIPERDVDCEVTVPRGQRLVVVGPNGAGKSTLLDAIAGHLPSRRGDRVSVMIEGSDVGALPLHRRGLGYLSQRPHLFENMSVLANVAYGPRSQGSSRADATSRARALLDQVGLREYAARRPSALSGGQAQKVALARVLAADPRVVLLDEPLAALDVEAQGEMRELIDTLLADRTVLIATHDVLDLAAWAERVLVLEAGRIRQDAPVASAVTCPRTAFFASLVGRAWVQARVTEPRVLVTDAGTRLVLPSDCGATGDVRVLIDPSDATAEDSPLPARLGSLGGRPVRYIGDVPVGTDLVTAISESSQRDPATALHASVAVPGDVQSPGGDPRAVADISSHHGPTVRLARPPDIESFPSVHN